MTCKFILEEVEDVPYFFPSLYMNQGNSLGISSKLPTSVIVENTIFTFFYFFLQKGYKKL
jgi:hypothetical protein